jgi:hypothetical protein
MMDRISANRARYRRGQLAGHYESFFVRANHPQRGQAFWIRYTLFAPIGRPEAAIGELWAIYFDAESGRHRAVKREVPFSQCVFDNDRFEVRVDESTLDDRTLDGWAATGDERIEWQLTYTGQAAPLLMLPARLYSTSLPKAKALVALPLARFQGHLIVDGTRIDIDDWVGSQNHNWGSKHTDQYAWGQVAGFDNAPESFLEVGTGRLKLGPVWTPWMTPLVLRHRGHEHALNSLPRAVRSRGRYRNFRWELAAENEAIRVHGVITAPPSHFVGLRYGNPPGGSKHCLNSKIASCELEVELRRSRERETLTTAHRAAFEILTDETDHGIAIRV